MSFTLASRGQRLPAELLEWQEVVLITVCDTSVECLCTCVCIWLSECTVSVCHHPLILLRACVSQPQKNDNPLWVCTCLNGLFCGKVARLMSLVAGYFLIVLLLWHEVVKQVLHHHVRMEFVWLFKKNCLLHFISYYLLQMRLQSYKQHNLGNLHK